MGTDRGSKASSDRQNWNRIFNGLVKMLQTQQVQLETLAKERKLLKDRIRMQHDRWVSDVRLFEEQVAQVKGDLVVQDMAASLEAAKSELVMGLKQKDAYLNKLRLAYAETELEDFKGLLDLLSKKGSDPKNGGRDSNRRSSSNTKNVEQHSENLESELRRLKQEYNKFALEKDAEVSALVAEKKFVWNQYKILETDCANKLKRKSSEVEQAEEKVQKLIAGMEELQSSNDEKDDRIARLTSQLTKMSEESNKFKDETSRLSQELDLLFTNRKGPSSNDEKDDRIARLTSQLTKMREESNKFKDETSRLSQELDLLRKSRSCAVTPVLGPSNRSIISRKESSAGQAQNSIEDIEKGGRRRSKRKGGDVASMSVTESPKLLSTSFKVPKLKNPSPRVRLWPNASVF
ncbi:hypothetical protein L484_016053 [Morus notabilis]|uniref:Uncharacterized protein n=1 Tax=Morus notabilis TaxID=981085 RepID=W9RNI3_9ROSA|nr:uncharacterized protein LOC21399125 [Morus notabilis]EXC00987.1 hypothetical protein L484_016053 [Morus notabilis]